MGKTPMRKPLQATLSPIPTLEACSQERFEDNIYHAHRASYILFTKGLVRKPPLPISAEHKTSIWLGSAWGVLAGELGQIGKATKSKWRGRG